MDESARVKCTAGCEDGKTTYQSGYSVYGSGYGDASPNYKQGECKRCDGIGTIHFDELTEKEWKQIGAEETGWMCPDCGGPILDYEDRNICKSCVLEFENEEKLEVP